MWVKLASMGIMMWCLAGVLPAGHAQDVVQRPRWYMVTDIGPAFVEDIPVKLLGAQPFHDKVKSRLRVDMDFGYRLTPYISTELELGYVNAQLEDYGQHDFIQIPIMVNLKLSWPNSSRFRPYAGIGLGGIETYVETTVGRKEDGDDFGFGWQILGGIEFDLTKHLALGFGYRYLAGPESHVTSYAVLGPVRTHSITLSLSYAF